ncbi:MAG TPA: glycerophosphodiester phosphodiesterase family protein [bacterium]|nr:glycerophosphodiester phosphodiesterase family protein [bacterium]
MLEQFFLTERPLLLAHRGASGHAPELTRAAFKRAIELGADGIELDVQLSRDDHLVVIHDDTLQRTTNGSGRVDQHLRRELEKLDAGSWFGPGFSQERIPDLSEILHFGPPGWRLNIELKSVPEPVRLAEKTAGLLEGVEDKSRLICTSFDPRILMSLDPILPGIGLGLIFAGVWPPDELLFRWPVWSAEQSLLSSERIESARARGIRVCAWTVNRVEEIERMITLGVDAIITNYPERFTLAMANLSRKE